MIKSKLNTLRLALNRVLVRSISVSFKLYERITRASHGAGDVRLDPFDIEQFGEKIT